jgi:hypothetical protein
MKGATLGASVLQKKRHKEKKDRHRDSEERKHRKSRR